MCSPTPRRTRFNPRSPCGERPCTVRMFSPASSFNPRSPCGERHPVVVAVARQQQVSTHAPLAGSDRTRPGATPTTTSFNPRSPCGERLQSSRLGGGARRVSTHAPLAGSDRDFADICATVSSFQPTLPLRGATPPCARCPRRSCCFNPRSPCGERHGALLQLRDVGVFQPTLPLRGATTTTASWPSSSRFNPRSPCGERPLVDGSVLAARLVSTHAPLAGSDGLADYSRRRPWPVSTHAPLAGSDRRSRACGRSGACGFNPRSPCGERPIERPCKLASKQFQPTLPLRGATSRTGS